MPKHPTKTRRQVRFLFSSGSPLKSKQKTKLASELRSRKIRLTSRKQRTDRVVKKARGRKQRR